mmetsp:Transcript_24791/g.63150  ORF Transcript_24791/g.63150 Transcript_24791/m.63150 type:complete len:257 (+) Transcript_24791:200-970(+)
MQRTRSNPVFGFPTSKFLLAQSVCACTRQARTLSTPPRYHMPSPQHAPQPIEANAMDSPSRHAVRAARSSSGVSGSWAWQLKAALGREPPSNSDSRIESIEGTVEPCVALPELLLTNDERRRAVHVRRTEEAVEALLAHRVAEGCDRRRRRPLQRLNVVTVGIDEIDAAEEAEGSPLAYRRVIIDEALHAVHHHGAETRGVADEVRGEHVLHTLVRTRQRHRVRLVGRPPSERTLLEELLDGLAHPDHREGQVGSA